MSDETCMKCGEPILIHRWGVITAVRAGKNKGREIKTPMWRHRPQVAAGAMCGDGTAGTVATPPAGKVYKE